MKGTAIWLYAMVTWTLLAPADTWAKGGGPGGVSNAGPAVSTGPKLEHHRAIKTERIGGSNAPAPNVHRIPIRKTGRLGPHGPTKPTGTPRKDDTTKTTTTSKTTSCADIIAACKSNCTHTSQTVIGHSLFPKTTAQLDGLCKEDCEKTATNGTNCKK